MLLVQLPLVLYIVMVEVTVGAVGVLVFLDWRNEVKRGFLISYALIYLALAGLTYLFQQNFATPELLASYTRLDQSWTGYQALLLLIFFLLLIPYSLFLLLDKSAGVQEKEGEFEIGGDEEAEVSEQPRQPSRWRLPRLLSGVATVIVGLGMLFVMGMIFRPVAPNFGGVFTVAGFFAGAFVLGGVLTAMWLGHWYLVTPALSERPLLFSTTVVLLALIVQIGLGIGAGPGVLFGTPDNASTPPVVTTPTPAPQATPAPDEPVQVKPGGAFQQAPLSAQQIGWIHILVGFVMPLVLGLLSWKLVRDRSFQSATGMLYLVVVCSIAGEVMGRGLFLGLL